jgi:hypothetical protein
VPADPAGFAAAFSVWVLKTPSPHASGEYSWIRPPSRSRRPSRAVAPGTGGACCAPVRAAGVVMTGVVAEYKPRVPLAGDQHPVQALAAGAGDPPCGTRCRRGGSPPPVVVAWAAGDFRRPCQGRRGRDRAGKASQPDTPGTARQAERIGTSTGSARPQGTRAARRPVCSTPAQEEAPGQRKHQANGYDKMTGTHRPQPGARGVLLHRVCSVADALERLDGHEAR